MNSRVSDSLAETRDGPSWMTNRSRLPFGIRANYTSAKGVGQTIVVSVSPTVGHVCRLAQRIGGEERQVSLATRMALRFSVGLWYSVRD
jgi:hypothetical protein